MNCSYLRIPLLETQCNPSPDAASENTLNAGPEAKARPKADRELASWATSF